MNSTLVHKDIWLGQIWFLVLVLLPLEFVFQGNSPLCSTLVLHRIFGLAKSLSTVLVMLPLEFAFVRAIFLSAQPWCYIGYLARPNCYPLCGFCCLWSLLFKAISPAVLNLGVTQDIWLGQIVIHCVGYVELGICFFTAIFRSTQPTVQCIGWCYHTWLFLQQAPPPELLSTGSPAACSGISQSVSSYKGILHLESLGGTS